MSSFEKLSLFSGHRRSILCCEFQSNGNVFFTASEDCTVALFDIRSENTEPIHRFSSFSGSSVVAVYPHPIQSDIFFASASNRVYCFDIRKGDEADPLHVYTFNKDEINSISINRKGSFLAAADDSGEIKVIDLDRKQIHKTLRNGHSNICSSVQFHPRRPWEAFSGGLDCQIIKWDFSTGKVRHSWNTADVASQPVDTLGPFCNPPLVHSLAVPRYELIGSGDGRNIVAAARGDGVISLYNIDPPAPIPSSSSSNGKASKTKLPKKRSEESQSSEEVADSAAGQSSGVTLLDASKGGHSSGASHVVFSEFKHQSQLLSGGNDRFVILWDYGNGEKESCAVERFKHGRKVNWMSTTPEHFIVADTTRNVQLYGIRQ